MQYYKERKLKKGCILKRRSFFIEKGIVNKNSWLLYSFNKAEGM